MGRFTRYVPDSMHVGIDTDADDFPPSIGALGVKEVEGGREGIGRDGRID